MRSSRFLIPNGNRKEAWDVIGVFCKNCKGKVKACDSQDRRSDYEWFCVNKDCENHGGERTYDDYEPEWVQKSKP